MAILKMKKLTVYAHKRDADALMRRLMRLRCVELKRSEQMLDEPGESFVDEEKCGSIERRISEAAYAIDLLAQYSKRKKGLTSGRASVRLDKFYSDGSYKTACSIVSEAGRIAKRLVELKTEENSRRTELSALDIWTGYQLPLDFAGTESCSVITVTFPAGISEKKLEDALEDVAAELIPVKKEKTLSSYSLICHRSDEEEALRQLSALGMLKTPFEKNGETAAKAVERNKRALAAIAKETEAATARLRELAESIELVETLYDFEVTALRSERSKENFDQTELCVVLEGWVPEGELQRVSGALEKFGCAFEAADPEEGEDAPVLLKNNFFASTFEWVLGMYSYPKYGRYDPTFIMSIFYFIIFGLMFADVGYGFILTVACFGALKLLNFKQGMRNFLAMFGYCGISSMAMGVLFGAYFGNMPQAFAENMLGVEGASSNMQTAVLFDPLQDPMSFLLIALAIGAVHLIAGMAVKFYILIKDGQWVDAICDILTWWLAFLGLGLMFIFPWGKYVALAGVASIVLTGGRHEKNIIMKLAKGLLALYGAVNFAADLLSYSRILALGLAATVIAQVVNTMGTMGGPSVVGFIIMVIVFVIGHILNLAINVLGTFVHTSRLQYIEFFGKFYEDGGKPFTPIVPSDKYTTE
ncbi:MAG: V-type ATP synthase subunit I [Clostridia bacterium]|nr:V-type ATP synthase subunit I [Clostridia bacterium]